MAIRVDVLELVLGVTRTPAMERVGLNFDVPACVSPYPHTPRARVAAMVRSDAHQGLINRGCSHFLGPAVVTVDGGGDINGVPWAPDLDAD